MRFKVVSGGQTGVDRAALDVALTFGLDCGGWCPKGRLAEDGTIPAKYPLSETKSPEYHVRTQRNVEGSSATLVVTRGAPTGGTRFTVEVAQSIRRPVLIADLDYGEAVVAEKIASWLHQSKPRILNVAGPRESGAPGITEQACRVLATAFELAGLRDGKLRTFVAAQTRSPADARLAD
ncbi:MAG: putative molybdenum carrier protein [Deltaproteobacteria bacterium]|nr:putative molybdenum carrier protein [Deltaproteobacteria bacterium]